MAHWKSDVSVFNFQVDEFKEVETPEEIREWEDLMRDQVRLAGFDFSKVDIGLRSTSCCGGRCDDCDQVAQ